MKKNTTTLPLDNTSGGYLSFETSGKERAAYSSFFVGQNIMFMLITQFLMLFYTDSFGLSVAAVTLLMTVARVWDAVNDPILGVIVNKSNLKGGKFKPWINATVFLLPLAFVAIFWGPELSDGGKLTYAYVTYILFGMVYTLSDIPIFSLATVMTSQPQERVQILSNGRVAAGLASMVTAVLGYPVVEALGWRAAAVLLSVIALLTMIPQAKATKERIKPKLQNVSFKDMFHFVKVNKYLQITSVGYLFMSVTLIGMSLTAYWAIYNLSNPSLIAPLMAGSSLGMILGGALAPKFVARYGKIALMKWLQLATIVFSVWIYFIDPSNTGLNVGVAIVRSAITFMPLVLLPMFISDAIEYGAAKTGGQRNEAVAFSVQTFITKIGMALGGVIAGVTMTATGYIANQPQTPEALVGIHWGMSLVPAMGALVWLLFIHFKYDLTEQKVAELSK